MNKYVIKQTDEILKPGITGYYKRQEKHKFIIDNQLFILISLNETLNKPKLRKSLVLSCFTTFKQNL